MTFDRLRLRNFQSHDVLDLPLDATVTTLVGDTEAGKSACVRALRWACLNQPQGTDFVGDFGDAPFARATLDFDGRRVTRARGRRNAYRLDDKRYVAFGSGVPKPVEDALNVSDFNFQMQGDAPLWFALPPAEVSRRLNAVVNLGEIDAALGAAANGLRTAKAEADVLKRRLKAAKAEAKELSWARDFDADLIKVEQLYARVDELNTRSVRLSDCVKRARIADLSKRRASAALGEIIAWRAKIRNLTAMRRRLARLRAIVERIKALKALVSAPPPTLAPVERLRAVAAKLDARRRRLVALTQGINNLEYAECHAKLEIESLQEKLQRRTGGRCPTCGRPLKP